MLAFIELGVAWAPAGVLGRAIRATLPAKGQIMIILVVLFVVFCLGVWALVRAMNRHHQNTWGEASGQEPGVKPVPEGKFWVGQQRNN